MRELLERHLPPEAENLSYDKVALTESSGDLLNLIRPLSLDYLDDYERGIYLSTRRLFSEIFSHIHFGDENAFSSNHISELKILEDIFKRHQDILKNATQNN
jgi:hypothetical protein